MNTSDAIQAEERKRTVIQQQRKHAVKKYVFLQLPGLGALILLLVLLENWIDLPGWALWSAPILWIVKDIVLFPFVWRAYLPALAEESRLIGETGISKQRLDPSGYIFVRGELWRAELERGHSIDPVEEGEQVLVVGREGFTLIVKPNFQRPMSSEGQ
ncbi:MAG: hypothetical protein C4576_18995 [Desulfobacteraceae bacterium]|nr:MAG: hypothetical protein C4576_18995 [Desulfobacteraceae bacterium]